MLKFIAITAALLPLGSFAAEASACGRGCHYNSCPTYSCPTYSCPASACPTGACPTGACPLDSAVPPAGPAVEDAPLPPMAGQTQRSYSVQPPIAPRAGTTYRSYSVQPAPTYFYQPAPVYRAAPRSMGRPQDEVINRKLHPGTYRFE